MLLLTVTIWALNFTVSKYILDAGLRPLPYSSLRYTAAALVFVALTYPRERSFRIARSDLPLVTLAVLLLLTNQLSFVFALDLTTATTAALLFGTLPIFTALISRLVGIERLGPALLDRGVPLLRGRRPRDRGLGQERVLEPRRGPARGARRRDLGRVLRRDLRRSCGGTRRFG